LRIQNPQLLQNDIAYLDTRNALWRAGLGFSNRRMLRQRNDVRPAMPIAAGALIYLNARSGPTTTQSLIEGSRGNS